MTSSSLLQQTLAVGEGGRLVIAAWPGSLAVRAGGRGVLRLVSRSRGVVPPPPVEIERDGDDVYVAAPAAAWLGWLPPRLRAGLRIEAVVPTRYAVELSTTGGGIEVCGVHGEVEARSRGGSVVVRDVRGPIEARSAGGAIAVCDCRGEVDLRSAGGTIDLHRVAGPVSLHARGGGIALEAMRALRPGAGGEGGRIRGTRLGAMALARSR